MPSWINWGWQRKLGIHIMVLVWKEELRKISWILLDRITDLKPRDTIPTTMIEFLWLIIGHLVMPAAIIQLHRYIRRWQVCLASFLSHVSLSSLGSRWAPLLRTKFDKKIHLERKHSGYDLFLIIFFFVCYFSLPPFLVLSLVLASSPSFIN